MSGFSGPPTFVRGTAVGRIFEVEKTTQIQAATGDTDFFGGEDGKFVRPTCETAHASKIAVGDLSQNVEQGGAHRPMGGGQIRYIVHDLFYPQGAKISRVPETTEMTRSRRGERRVTPNLDVTHPVSPWLKQSP
jgi:hypothetical protein